MPNRTDPYELAEQHIMHSLGDTPFFCPPFEVLLALESGALPAELAASAQAHVTHCRLCARLLADLRELARPALTPAQSDRIRGKLPAARRLPPWPLLSAIAALVLLAAFLAVHLDRQAPPRVASVNLPPALGKRVAELPFAPLAAPQAAVLLTRGLNASGNPSTQELLPAFQAYNHHDYALAAQRFSGLAVVYPKSQFVALYLGVSQLAVGRDAQAEITLQHAQGFAQPYDLPAVMWYSAVAGSRNHDAQAARWLVSLCVDKQSPYSAASCEALR